MSDLHVDPAEGFSIQEMYQLLHLLKKLQHCLGYVPAAVEGPIEGRDYPTPHRPRPGWTAA